MLSTRPGTARDVGRLARTTRRGHLALLVAAAALGAGGLFVLLYATSVHAVPGNSDGATVILEGKALSAGHLTLNHWFLSLDSFWWVDVPFYALAVLAVGVRPELLQAVPAVIGTLVVAVGAWLAAGRSRGAAALAGAGTVVAVLALPSHALAFFLLQGPLHVGTALYALLAFACVRRYRPGRVRWVLAVVLVAAGTLGDLQMLVFGAAPMLGGGVLAMVRRRELRAGAAAASAAVCGAVLALAGRELAKLVGTYTINSPAPGASLREMATNLRLVGVYGARLFGLGSAGFGSGGMPAALLAVHLVALAALLAGFAIAAARLVAALVAGRRGAEEDEEAWRLDDMLLLAFLADLAIFVYLTPAPLPSYARYLTASAIFGAVLAGRAAARLAALLARGVPAAALAGLGVVVVCLLAAGTGYALGQPDPSQPASELGTYLAAHGLTRGIGDYWSASIVTVESKGAVVVRPVTGLPAGRIVAYTRNSSSTWYEGKTFQFLVYNPALPFGGVDEQSASATFGPPSEKTAVDGYLVLRWPHPLSAPVPPGA